MKYKRPSQNDYRGYLLQLVYGPFPNHLEGCINSSYLDVCRTLTGFGKFVGKGDVKSEAMKFLNKQFRRLEKVDNINNQELFDKWHKNTCEELIEIFPKTRNFSLHYGQAQKWCNMIFKNIYVCGEVLIPGCEKYYGYCHCPIDNIVLRQLRKRKVMDDKPKVAWSRWGYDKYINYQKDLREHFNNQPLLNVEFRIWLDGRNKD
jgi:hypothetical protein